MTLSIMNIHVYMIRCILVYFSASMIFCRCNDYTTTSIYLDDAPGCYPADLACDGNFDCYDVSDERNCSKFCWNLLNENLTFRSAIRFKTSYKYVSEIGADSYLCWWGSISGESCSFFIVLLSKGLSLHFICSVQRVKYRMPFVFLLTCNLLLDWV